MLCLGFKRGAAGSTELWRPPYECNFMGPFTQLKFVTYFSILSSIFNKVSACQNSS